MNQKRSKLGSCALCGCATVFAFMALSVVVAMLVPADLNQSGNEVAHRSEPTPPEEVPTVKISTNQNKQHREQTDFVASGVSHPFSSPRHVARALVAHGYDASRWANRHGYYSSLAIREVTSGGNRGLGDVPNEISWYIQSKSATRVEVARLTANVFNISRAAVVHDEFAKLTSSLFAELRLACPEGLLQSIAKQRDFTSTTSYGLVTFKRDDTYNMGHGLVLEFEVEQVESSSDLAATGDRPVSSFEELYQEYRQATRDNDAGKRHLAREFRTWTSGSHTVVAKLKSAGAGKVTLIRKDNGKEIVVSQDILSDSDRDYLRKEFRQVR